ncbi:MAG: hypothetical protein ACTHOB_11685 [Ginsengibacter sp.]
MKAITKIGLLLLISGFIFFLAASWLSHVNKKNKAEDRIRRLSVENIQFKGKVMSSIVIDRYGKQYIVLCIKLDYTNTDSVYIFNNLSALRIKDGIATIPGGLYEKGLIASYVEINMDNSLKNKIYYQNGEEREYEIGLGSGGLIENDMKDCN